MATPPSDPRSWPDLVARARQSPVPPDLDVRPAILAELSQAAPLPDARPSGILEELFVLCGNRWMQAGLTGLALVATVCCWRGFAGLDELAVYYAVYP